MARRSKETRTPAVVEGVLGMVAAVVWFITQGVGWLRLVAAGAALGAALLVATAVASRVGPGSTWDPHFAVLAPGAAVVAVAGV